MTWQIDGEAQGVALGDYDGSGWQWRLTADDDPSESRIVLVRITGTAMAMCEEALTERAALARKTLGRSEVEVILGWPEPPDEIEATSEGVQRFGGDPGPEQREINDILDWFHQRGAEVFLAGHGGGRGDTLQVTHHSAYVAVRGADTNMFKTEGTSYLEAVRAAKAKWENDRLGTYIQLQPAEERSTAVPLSITIGGQEVDRRQKAQEAAKSSGREFFIVAWEPLPGSGEGKAPHLIEVTNRDGDLVDGGIGDDPENSLLEIAEQLLPTWHKPPEADTD
jgi:hypothetical protein